MMSTLGVPEDQPIENKLVSKAISSAQSKIEGINFDARKHLLKYDDVMNKQREKIYKLRRSVLFSKGKEIEEIAKDILKDDEEGLKKMESKKELFPKENFYNTIKNILLRVIDMLWVGHLEEMDYMRSSVGLRAYGNQDPLVEYKNEGIRLFKTLENSIGATFSKLISNVIPADNQTPQPIEAFESGVNSNLNKKNVGRNEPCPCGSGKKYKKCHGK